MRVFAIIAFIACLIAVAHGACSLHCHYRKKPVCAERNILGKYEFHTFTNECLMREENECHGGNWMTPCSHKKEGCGCD